MDQSTVSQDSSASLKFLIGFGIIGLISMIFLIICCCRTKNKDHNNHQSNTRPTESFQQLYFTKKTSNQIKNIVKPTIERWSSITQPSMTFYRVYMQDTYDNYYQPVNEERLRSSIEQSKAMEYAGLEIIFF